MNITLSMNEYNRIIKGCTPALDKSNVHPCLTYIEISHDGSGLAYATALDGYVMNQIQFRCKGDEGTFLLPHFCKFAARKPADITIVWDSRTVSVTDGETTIVKARPDCEDLNRRKIAQDRYKKQTMYTIAVNPKLLIAALRVCESTNKVVCFEFASDIDSIVMRADDACCIVLPMRFNDERCRSELATFYGMSACNGVGATDG